jgi:RHS repeat-associated protein
VAGTETTTYSHDASSRLTSSSGPAGDATYTYDAAGYMTAIAAPNDQDSRFAYDAAGRLTELASPEADQSYSYGPSGRRVAAETSTEGSEGKLDYLWDPSFSLGQIAEVSGSQERSFAYGGGRIAQTGPGGSSYLQTDNLGSVVATSDERGSRTARTTYNPYGSPAEAKGKPPERSSFAYTGQLREAAKRARAATTCARDYDPEMAAFQTPDPLSPGLGEPAVSPYSYVGGRPTRMVDPSGMIGIGDVTPDFVEDAAKTVDDNLVDPVGNGISEVPGAVDDGWDATAGVRHTIGGAAEDSYKFAGDHASDAALVAGVAAFGVCTVRRF